MCVNAKCCMQAQNSISHWLLATLLYSECFGCMQDFSQPIACRHRIFLMRPECRHQQTIFNVDVQKCLPADKVCNKIQPLLGESKKFRCLKGCGIKSM